MEGQGAMMLPHGLYVNNMGGQRGINRLRCEFKTVKDIVEMNLR